MGVTDPINYKKPGRYFSENRAPGVLQPLVSIQALLLTLSTLPWKKDVLQRPHARFAGATVPIWVSRI